MPRDPSAAPRPLVTAEGRHVGLRRLQPKAGPAMVRIVLTRRGQRLTSPRWAAALRRLPTEEQVRIGRYRRWEDAQSSLLGCLLLRELLADYHSNCGGAAAVISRNSRGRPCITSSVHSELDVNLSHSGEYIAAAISEVGRIGIDIEIERDIEPRIGDLFFTPSESTHLAALPADARRSVFFQLWTLKEAYGKAMGGGLLEELCQIELDRSDTRIRMRPVGSRDSSSQWHFHSWSPAPGVWLSACAEHTELPCDVEAWPL